MPSIPGKYQHYKNENLDEYFSAIGIPFMTRKMMSQFSPLMEIILEGNTMRVKSTSMLKTVESTFELGVEYDEAMPGGTLKCISKIDGNDLVTECVRADNGHKSTRRYVFTDDGCVITETHEKSPVPWVRHFNRVE